jgi:hypothetical protein
LIYCIGNHARYEAKLAVGGLLYKIGRGIRKGTYYEGGSVWQTEDDARAFIVRNKLEDSRTVYGVLADWETDTLPVPRESYRRLLRTSPIVRLQGDGSGLGAAPAERAARDEDVS